MPNIPPLISAMPDSQPLYASYTVSGGGGAQIILNNGGQTAVPGDAALVIAANTTSTLGSVTINTDYGTEPIAPRQLLLGEIVGLSVTSTSTPEAGDTLTFYILQGVTQLSPSVTISGAALNLPTPVVLNAFGDMGVSSTGPNSYDVELVCRYTTTGTGDWTLDTGTGFTLNAQILACVAS